MRRIRLVLLVATAAALLLTFAVAPAIALADATISGTVTDANTGATIFFEPVEVYAQVDGTWSDNPSFGVNTDNSGFYSLSLPAGSYQVCFNAYGNFQDMWWGGAADRLSAATLTLSDGDNQTINAALALKPVTIEGFTRDMDDVAVPGITVSVFKAGDGSLVGTTTSDANGKYDLAVDGLFAGIWSELTNLKVSFSDSSDSYATQFYDQATSLDTAAPQQAGPGDDLSLDSWLVAPQPGEIKGTTLTATGVAVPDIQVNVVDPYGNPLASTTSDASGHYDVTGLQVAYNTKRDVRFSDPSGTYKNQAIQGISVPPGSPVTVDSALLSTKTEVPAGEGDWAWQNPHPQGNDLNGISGPDVGQVWAVGNAGAILVSSDGGLTWQTQLSGTEADLYGVSFSDATHGWVVGAGGTVLATTDAGAHWTSQQSNTNAALWSVHFADTSHGWAVGSGGAIVATTNGGASWADQTSNTVYGLECVTSSDASHGWIVGDYGKVLVTTNGGQQWTTQDSKTTNDLLGVSMPDGEHGWVATDGGHILATTDGGAHWAVQDTWTGHQFTSVCASDATDCWATDASGYISSTTDGGAHWYWNVHTSQVLLGICCPSAQRGWAVGTAGTILYTGNGQNWSPMNWQPAGVFTFDAVSFADSTHGIALGDHGTAVYSTTNGGTSWKSEGVGTGLNGVSFPDQTHAWTVGSGGAIYATTNGGAAWGSQTSNTNAQLCGVAFPDALHGWAVGDSGVIVATTDGGADWTPQVSGTNLELMAVSFADDTHGVAVGYGGTLLTTTNGGSTWTKAVSGTTEELYGVSCPNDDDAWAVGGNGAIVASSDGYGVWKPQNAGGSNFSVSFCNSDDGWIASSSGILATTDGGTDWVPQIAHCQFEMFGVSAVDAAHCWAVGDGGTILARYTPPVDTTPPVTTCQGADALWHRTAVTLTLTATDEAGGSGMVGGSAETQYKIDTGAWTTGTSVVVDALANHSNDGIRTVGFCSTDATGNVETAKSVTVKIDSTGPVTAGKAVKGKKRRAVKLSYCASDTLSPQVLSVRLVIKNSHGKVVKSFSLGTRTNKRWYTVSWTPKAAGKYSYVVTARDLAGNIQTRQGGGRITIR